MHAGIVLWRRPGSDYCSQEGYWRLGIALRLAAEPETCACDFAEVFGVSQPTSSQHLRQFLDANYYLPAKSPCSVTIELS